MEHEMMDLDQLAAYLKRDVREVTKLADRGHLPGRKVAGKWRFASSEINYWIETQLPGYSEQQLTALESHGAKAPAAHPLVASLLQDATMAVPLEARTRASVLQEMVRLAEQSWHVYDPPALLEAIRQREELASTALESGVAIPHPRRPQPGIMGESVLAYGRTASSIPFGNSGEMCDIFFLPCCRDTMTHLRVLARISRMLRQPGLVDELRQATSIHDTRQLLEQAERKLGK